MSLDEAARPYQPPTHTMTFCTIGGRVLTIHQVVELALTARDTGRHEEAQTLLAKAGLTNAVLTTSR